MATVTSKVCDVDPKHGDAESVVYGTAGEFFTADLCEADRGKLDKALEPYLAVGTPVELRDLARNGNTGGGFNPSVVRSWAQANGIPIADKGRVPAETVEKWRAATQPK